MLGRQIFRRKKISDGKNFDISQEMAVTLPTHTHTRTYGPARLQEPANGVRRGHPRVVPYSKMSSNGRITLQINLSEAIARNLLVTSSSAELLKKLRTYVRTYAVSYTHLTLPTILRV